MSELAIDRSTRNLLLAALPDVEYDRLMSAAEAVVLEYGHVVCDVYAPIRYVYFPDDGVISSVSMMVDGSAVETATIGPEGMTGIAVFHGVLSTAEHVFVQVPGHGHRLPVRAFRELLTDSPVLAGQLSRYTVALLTLTGQNSACNRKHTMVQRCARWMLMSLDRVHRDNFEMTHHILSQMLGVRRASVTEAALMLSQAGAIEYSRGLVTVTNRDKLERQSCECYAIIRAGFDRAFGRTPANDPLAGRRFTEGGLSTASDGTPASENDPPR